MSRASGDCSNTVPVWESDFSQEAFYERVASYWFFLVLRLDGVPAIASSTPDEATELQQLKALVWSQQKTLEQQQAQIQALQSAMAEQDKKLTKLTECGGAGANTVSPAEHSETQATV